MLPIHCLLFNEGDSSSQPDPLDSARAYEERGDSACCSSSTASAQRLAGGSTAPKASVVLEDQHSARVTASSSAHRHRPFGVYASRMRLGFDCDRVERDGAMDAHRREPESRCTRGLARHDG